MSYRPTLLLFNRPPYNMSFNRLVGPTYSLNQPTHRIYTNKYYYYDATGVLPVVPIATRKWRVGENFLILYHEGESSGITEWVMTSGETGTSTITCATTLSVGILDSAEAVIGSLGGWSESNSWEVAVAGEIIADHLYSEAMSGAFSEYEGPLHGIVLQEDVNIEVTHTPQTMIPLFSMVGLGENRVEPNPLRF